MHECACVNPLRGACAGAARVDARANGAIAATAAQDARCVGSSLLRAGDCAPGQQQGLPPSSAVVDIRLTREQQRSDTPGQPQAAVAAARWSVGEASGGTPISARKNELALLRQLQVQLHRQVRENHATTALSCAGPPVSEADTAVSDASTPVSGADTPVSYRKHTRL